MDGYHVALFIHFCALIGAIAAAAIVHLGTGRRARAKTVAEMLEWHNIVMTASKGFPLALVTLVLTGSYMLRAGGIWRSGFVVSGLIGVVLLFAIGITLSIKGRAARERLEPLVSASPNSPPPVMSRDSVGEALQNIPLGIVVAVMFNMTTKPLLGTALLILALGVVAGGVVGILHSPARARSRLTTEG